MACSNCNGNNSARGLNEIALLSNNLGSCSNDQEATIYKIGYNCGFNAGFEAGFNAGYMSFCTRNGGNTREDFDC